jgi:type I restriction enzyme M protein
MEKTKYDEVLEMVNGLYRHFTLNGYQKNEAYKEVETIFFFAATLKDERFSLKDEEETRIYFRQKESIEGIDINQVLQNMTIYDENVDDLYKKLISYSNDKIKDLFEYIQRNKEAKKDTEAITSSDIAKLVMYLCKDNSKESFADICSGEGTMLVEAANAGYKRLDGYEINVNSALLSRMRAVINKATFNIKECDVLQEKMCKVYDATFSQPPFSLRTYQPTKADEDETLQYSKSSRVNKADWHFILKAINATREGGKTIALVSSGLLINTPDSFYRQQIIRNGKLDTVILLPSGIIPSTNISTSILVFSDNNEKIRFVDASSCYKKLNGYEKKLDIEKVIDLLNNDESEKVSTINCYDIKDDNYSLDVLKYLNMDSRYSISNPALLKDYAEVIPGFQYTTKKITELDPKEGNVSVVKITNITDGGIDYDNLTSIEIEKNKIEKYLLKENDILVSTKGTALKFALVENLERRMLVPYSNLTIIRCNKELNPLYLITFLKSQAGTTLFKSIQTGSTIMIFTQKAIENFEFPLVSAHEQSKIANEYKEINEKILKIKKQLIEAEKELETLWEGRDYVVSLNPDNFKNIDSAEAEKELETLEEGRDIVCILNPDDFKWIDS